MNKVFLHVDLDAFFASVEQLDHPEYRGKPVIVGGLPGDRRAVVSTASYEARKFGVHSAMPIFQAVKLCPHAIYVRGNYKRYHEKSEEVMSIFREYSPDIQQISVDEAFIDLTGTERLFGSPEETARRLKNEVREKTGLTVSVGLSSTKYCAKIASGLQKPDGLTVVPFGKETEFMLSLPLTKVWGAGKKTLEKLERYGIKTTRDIYARSEKLLQSLFGNAAGTFLYNAVRGNENADFRVQPKTRSISAENTFEYDLTDTDAIETALLSLSHTVMFRSLREKVRSTAVAIKIRYEDFSTVSVQETSERYVSSVDDLFERAKNLFYKKRDARLGIRLLGVGLQNIEDDTTPRQQELFDFGEEKKRKLESAILKAQEKNPDLKITRARLLGKSLAFLSIFSLFALFSLEKASTESANGTEKEADGASGIVFDTSRLPLSDSGAFVSLFNKDFGEQNIEFFAEGYWKSTVTGELAYSFGFGSTPALSTSTPVFVQNVDLSLYFMLNHHWYFEAAFADEFTKNTVAAGYIGDGYLKSARISNRKIVFPSIYSVSDVNRGIGGGENQAPGISFNWAGEKWQADAAFRYDMLQSHEKTWYGKNSVSINEIALSNFNTGNQYILPTESLVQNVKDIYVESSSGTYRDKKGRKYKKLDSSQYLLLKSQNQILLSKDAKASRKSGTLPSVAVTFYSGFSTDDFDKSKYENPETFLGKIQTWFSSKNPKIKLAKYSYELISQIDGEDALLIQSPAGFSPFMMANRYDAGSSSATDAQIAYSSTGTASSAYSAVICEDNFRFSETDFFYSNHLYIDVSISDDDETTDETEKLIHESFPFAGENPKIYLGGDSNEDLCLQVRSFSPVNRFEIGTDAVGGTVTVYKNGVIDPTAEYDEESGTITLSSGVSSSDHITARWYEESEDSESGAFSAAGGFKYDFTEKISGDVSASTRWSYSPDREFSDESYSSQGFATLASKISYAGENFSAKNTAAVSYENADTSGNYRILGCDDKETETNYLSKSAGTDLPGGFAPILNEKTGSGTTQIELKSEKNGSISASDGKTDSGLSGYAIPLEWDFSGLEAGTGENQVWSAITVYTPGIASSLSNASNFSIALKNPNYEGNFSGCTLYLQLGVSADDDFSVEESEKIPAWKISDPIGEEVKSNFDFSAYPDKANGWQTVTVTLSDEDRSAISSLNEFNARLILVSSDTASCPKNGEILIGAYETGEATFSFKSSADVRAENYQETDASLSSSKIKKFNSSSTNYIQKFDWKFDSDENESEILTFTRTFSEVDLSAYKRLSFFLKAENAESVTLTLSRPKSGGEEKALAYKIENPKSEWNEYTVDLTNGTGSNLTHLDTSVVPTKLTIEITAKENGTLSFDELFLSENTPFVVLEDKIEASYKIDGAILKTDRIEILKDLKISGKGNAATSIETENGSQKENALQTTGNLGFTLTNLRIETTANLSNTWQNEKSSDSTQKNSFASGSHSIETEKPILNALTFSENYVYSAEEGSLEKSNAAKLDFSRYSVPVSLLFDTKATSDSWALSQNMNAKIDFTPKKLKFNAEAKANQKILTSSANSNGKEKFETENYARSWKKITDFAFDTGSENASKRTTGAKSSLSYSFDTLKLKPSIFFETEAAYKSASKTTFTDTTKAGFEIPFSVAKNNFAFSWKKTAGSTEESEKGGDYSRDATDLQKSLSEKSYFLKSAPIYDLLSKKLAENVQETDRESNSYTGAYSFSWKRAFFANKYDFFVPQSVKLDLTRDIRTGTTTSDFYQIKNTASYAALNIFGRNGTLPLFSAFRSDEYNGSLSLAAKIPRKNPENFSFLLSGYVQATFYFTESNYLKNGLEGSFEGKDDWKGKFTLVWKRNAENSLAKGAVAFFKSERAEKITKITKTDSLNMGVSRASGSSPTSSPVQKYNLAYNHETETQVTKYVSINTAVGAAYYANWGKSATLTATATLGATVKF